MSSINFVTPINKRSYGICGVNLLAALQNITDVSLFPIGPQEYEARFRNNVERGLVNAYKFSLSDPSIRLWHQFALAEHVSTKLRIGFPIFELDKFNKIEEHHLSSQDCLFVPSQWAKSIIEQNGIKVPTYVVPLGIDSTIFRPMRPTGLKEILNPTNDSYVEGRHVLPTFLCIAKWEKRKCHDLLPAIFHRALGDKKYKLFMSCHNPFLSQEETNNWKKQYEILGDNVQFIDWLNSDLQIAQLINDSDCLISLSRAEGWNLPALEALACGKHVISTNYSAHTEFLNRQNSMMVDIDETEPAYDGKWFFKQGNWAKIGDRQEEQAIEFIRAVYHKKINGTLGVNQAGLETSRRFTWSHSAMRIVEFLEGME